VVTKAVSARIGVITDLKADRNAPVATVGIVDATEEVDAGDPGTDEAKVDDGNEWAADSAELVELVECEDTPCSGEDGDDEESQNVVGNIRVILDIWVDEPSQHANNGKGDQDLEQAKA
jgi:hypothetical protein